MDRINSQRVILTLGLVVVLLASCGPLPGISTAQQTAVAATGMAAANGMLTPSVGAQTPVPATATASSSATSSAGLPVTGGTAPAMTGTTGTNGTSATSSVNGSSGSSGNATPAATSSGALPNTGATTAAPSVSNGTTGTTTAGSTSGCNSPLNAGAGGPIATLWIKNDTGSPIDFTMGIAGANSFGQCGFLTWGPIKANQSLRVGVPVTQTALGDSCYWAYAVVNSSSGRQSIVSGESGGYCITTPTRWVINIHSDRIRLAGQ